MSVVLALSPTTHAELLGSWSGMGSSASWHYTGLLRTDVTFTHLPCFSVWVSEAGETDFSPKSHNTVSYCWFTTRSSVSTTRCAGQVKHIALLFCRNVIFILQRRKVQRTHEMVRTWPRMISVKSLVSEFETYSLLVGYCLAPLTCNLMSPKWRESHAISLKNDSLGVLTQASQWHFPG